jgi:four helix bundle protein
MTHKTLDAWKYSMNLTVDIYTVTKEFPKEEMYGITNQIRRCAVSISSNIAEGCARQSAKETVQFLYISLGSNAELETQLLISQSLNYIKDADELLEKIKVVKGLILGLIKFFKSKV